MNPWLRPLVTCHFIIFYKWYHELIIICYMLIILNILIYLYLMSCLFRSSFNQYLYGFEQSLNLELLIISTLFLLQWDFYSYDCRGYLVPTWLMNVFPSATRLYNQEIISETLKPTLFYWVLFEIVLACFFSLGNNFWHKQ